MYEKIFWLIPLFGLILLFGCKKEGSKYSLNELYGTWILKQVNNQEPETDAKCVLVLDESLSCVYGRMKDSLWQNSNSKYCLEDDAIIIDTEDACLKLKMISLTEDELVYVVSRVINGMENNSTDIYTMERCDKDYSRSLRQRWVGGRVSDSGDVPDAAIWEYKNDSTYIYSYKNELGEWKEKTDNDGRYYVFGNLLVSVWNNDRNSGLPGPACELWKIEIEDHLMTWKGLRDNGKIVRYRMRTAAFIGSEASIEVKNTGNPYTAFIADNEILGSIVTQQLYIKSNSGDRITAYPTLDLFKSDETKTFVSGQTPDCLDILISKTELKDDKFNFVFSHAGSKIIVVLKDEKTGGEVVSPLQKVKINQALMPNRKTVDSKVNDATEYAFDYYILKDGTLQNRWYPTSDEYLLLRDVDIVPVSYGVSSPIENLPIELLPSVSVDAPLNVYMLAIAPQYLFGEDVKYYKYENKIISEEVAQNVDASLSVSLPAGHYNLSESTVERSIPFKNISVTSSYDNRELLNVINTGEQVVITVLLSDEGCRATAEVFEW